MHKHTKVFHLVPKMLRTLINKMVIQRQKQRFNEMTQKAEIRLASGYVRLPRASPAKPKAYPPMFGRQGNRPKGMAHFGLYKAKTHKGARSLVSLFYGCVDKSDTVCIHDPQKLAALQKEDQRRE